MNRLPYYLLSLLLAGWSAAGNAAAQAIGQPEGDIVVGQDWVRLLRDDDGDVVAMQTAVVRYVAAPGGDSPLADRGHVDLVGAIHVADAAYYDRLNNRFQQYDALLYELVAPDGTVVPRGRGTSNAHPVGALQNGMKRMLELEHQLEQIDYTRPNFVHADMSPDQFAQSMQDKGEGFLQMYFRLLGQSIGKQSQMAAKGESTDLALLTALLAPDRARRLKITMAEQLAEMESLFMGLGGDEGSTLIAERNKVALAKLREQMATGKSRLGVFYGAGHLGDMDVRLREDFGLRPASITWMTAWDLSAE